MKSVLAVIVLTLGASTFAETFTVKDPEKLACYLRKNQTEFSVYYGSTLLDGFSNAYSFETKPAFESCNRAINVARLDKSYIRIDTDDTIPTFEVVTREELLRR